jgi:hypothetical protein
MFNQTEKREYLRMDLDCNLEYRVKDSDVMQQGLVVNLSAKGILFTVQNSIDEGELVHIKLSPVNNITPPMLAETRVIRCIRKSEDEFRIAAEITSIE